MIVKTMPQHFAGFGYATGDMIDPINGQCPNGSAPIVGTGKCFVTDPNKVSAAEQAAGSQTQAGCEADGAHQWVANPLIAGAGTCYPMPQAQIAARQQAAGKPVDWNSDPFKTALANALNDSSSDCKYYLSGQCHWYENPATCGLQIDGCNANAKIGALQYLGVNTAQNRQQVVNDAVNSMQSDMLQSLMAHSIDLSAVFDLISAVTKIAVDYNKALFGGNPQAAHDIANPFHPGGETYNFIMSNNPTDIAALDIITDMIFGVLIAVVAIASGGSAIPEELGPAVALTDVASCNGTPCNGYTKLVRDIVGLGTESDPGKRIQKAYAVANDAATILAPFPVGLLTKVQIVQEFLTNLPVVPVLGIMAMVAEDPVFQKNATNAGIIPQGPAAHLLPIATNCLKAGSSGHWLDCFQQILDDIFGDVVTLLSKKMHVRKDHLRTIANALWKSATDVIEGQGAGGTVDLGTMLDPAQFPGVHDAIVAIGPEAVRVLGGCLGIADVEGFLRQTVIPALPADLQDVMKKAIDFYELIQTVITEAQAHGGADPGDMVDRALTVLGDKEWKLDQALIQMKMDATNPDRAISRLSIFSYIPTRNIPDGILALLNTIFGEFPALASSPLFADLRGALGQGVIERSAASIAQAGSAAIASKSPTGIGHGRIVGVIKQGGKASVVSPKLGSMAAQTVSKVPLPAFHASGKLMAPPPPPKKKAGLGTVLLGGGLAFLLLGGH